MGKGLTHFALTASLWTGQFQHLCELEENLFMVSVPPHQALISGYLSESTFDHVANVFVDCNLNTLDSASASETPEIKVRQPTYWIKGQARGPAFQCKQRRDELAETRMW